MAQANRAPKADLGALLQALAVNIIALRQAGNWSTRALAEHCALDRRTLQRLERGELRTLSLESVDKLARGLGVQTGSLLSDRPLPRREHERPVFEVLANNLVQRREGLGWSQQALADVSRVSRPVIGNIERQARNPELQTLLKLADSLAVTVPELLLSAR